MKMKVPDGMFIHGEWVDAEDGSRIGIIDPATEEEVGSVPVATEGDLDRALASAEKGWREWSSTDAWTRSAALREAARIMRDRLDGISMVMTEEQGKTLKESRGEVSAAIDQFDWFADEARRIYGRLIESNSKANRLMVMRQPIGPVAAFSPWNFPALLSARKIAPAIAAGCSVIVKPAGEAPRTTLCMVDACNDAGIPPGVVNAVTGNSSLISRHLISSPVIRKVTFTGSLDVGRLIHQLCTDGVKPASLELGGHSPVVVFEDADVDDAAVQCATAKFRNNGQVCISPSRFFVQEPVYDRFVERFVEVVKGLRVGDGRLDDTDLGPLANKRRLEVAESFVEDAVRKGAGVPAGGKRHPGFDRGFFFEPTVLVNVDTSMRIMIDEPFCPVAPIAPFSTFEDAMEKANSTVYGLAGYVFTRSTDLMYRAVEGIEAGLIGVNNLVIARAEAPFGGIKLSGSGKEGGAEGIESYLISKYVNIRL